MLQVNYSIEDYNVRQHGECTSLAIIVIRNVCGTMASKPPPFRRIDGDHALAPEE